MDQKCTACFLGLWIHALFFGHAWAAERKLNEYSEPPLEVSIAIDGEHHRLRTSEVSQIEINGRKVAIVVDASDYRTLQVSDVAFRYPGHMAFDVDRDDEAVEVWTLDGNETVIMLFRFAKSAGDVTEDVVAGVENQFGKKNAKRSNVTMELGGAKRQGIRVDARAFQSIRICADYFFLPGKSYNYVLGIQESTEDEEQTKETQRTLKLLQESFTLTSSH